MKIEAGKYYLTRDGRKVGPMNYKWSDIVEFNGNVWWRDDGSVYKRKETPRDLVAEWTEESIKWSDMTPAQKGALLLAHHEGKEIEYRYPNREVWEKIENPSWNPVFSYRVKPKPKRETVTITAEVIGNHLMFTSAHPNFKITLDMVDDEPDCSSIRMMKMSEQI
jgi:hypothetical protein